MMILWPGIQARAIAFSEKSVATCTVSLVVIVELQIYKEYIL